MRRQTLAYFATGFSILWLSSIAIAQTSAESTTVESPSHSSVTFVFASDAGGSSLRQGETGDNRYYVRVAISNNPSLQLDSPVEIKVDRDKVNKDVLIYSFAFRNGTSPQVEVGASRLKISFVSPDSDDQASVRSSLSGPSSGSSVVGDVTPIVLTGSTGTLSRASTVLSPLRAVTPTLATVSSGVPASIPAGNPKDSSLATEQTPFSTSKPIGTTNVDMAVPESPAFTVLGVTPETVVRPTSPRKFASALLNGVDQNGNFQSGIALDAAPYLLLAGEQLRLRDYQERYLLRLLARTQMSFGTTKGASEDDKSMRLALGLHATLWDKGDPHNDKTLMSCFADALKFPEQLPPVPVDDPGPGATPGQTQAYQNFLTEKRTYDLANAAVGEANNVRVEKCRETAREENWNRSSWIVAVAPSWISPTGQTKDMRWNGGGFWSSLAYGFEGVPGLDKNSQLIVHARYRNNESVANPNEAGQFLIKNTFFFGSKLRVGNENSSASFEGVYLRSKEKGQPYDTSSRFSFGLERRIAENMWFNLSFGSDRGRNDGNNKGFVLTSFKWGFSEKKNPLGSQ